MGFLRKRKVHRFSQIAISVAAYVAWVMASPGPFQVINDYPEVIGTFALLAIVLVTVVFQVKPLPESVIEDSKP